MSAGADAVLKLQTSLSISAASSQAEVLGTLVHRWFAADGHVLAEHFRTGAFRYLVRFPDISDFQIDLERRSVTAHPVPGTDQATVLHLYLNQARPLAISASGGLVLHAGAVRVGPYAIGFLGPSGRGKSTLCASFASSGTPFLTDDGLELREDGVRYWAQPQSPTVRLWQDSLDAVVGEAAENVLPVSYTSKARILANDQLAHCDQELPLGCLFALGNGRGDDVIVRPMSSQEALLQVIQSTFVLDVEDRATQTRHFDQVTRLVSKIPGFWLDYPRHYDMLNIVKQKIVDVCRSTLEQQQ